MAAEEELGHKIIEHTLSITNEQTVEMYHGSKIISAQCYKGFGIIIYTLSNTASGKGLRKIFIYKTDEIIDTKKDKTYITTVYDPFGGAYHIFEEK